MNSLWRGGGVAAGRSQTSRGLIVCTLSKKYCLALYWLSHCSLFGSMRAERVARGEQLSAGKVLARDVTARTFIFVAPATPTAVRRVQPLAAARCGCRFAAPGFCGAADSARRGCVRAEHSGARSSVLRRDRWLQSREPMREPQNESHRACMLFRCDQLAFRDSIS